MTLHSHGWSDTALGVRCTEPDHHACRWLGVAVGGTAIHAAEARLAFKPGEQLVPVCGEDRYRLVFGY